jgi:hypothetical protein
MLATGSQGITDLVAGITRVDRVPEIFLNPILLFGPAPAGNLTTLPPTLPLPPLGLILCDHGFGLAGGFDAYADTQ